MKPKYRLSIVAINYWSADFLSEQLQKLFGNLFEITCHSPDTTPINPVLDSDLILLHEPSVLPKMQKYIFSDCPILLIRRTIKNNYFQEIKKIPPKSTAVVVNLNTYMAQETMFSIYQMGIKDIYLDYWSPEEKEFPKCGYIITPRDYSFLKQINIPKIIIGSRVLTADMIMDILSYFNIKMDIAENIILEHLIEAPSFFHGVNYLMKNNKSLMVQWDLLFNKINKGIAVVDSKGKINSINNNFFDYLDLNREQIKISEEEDLLELLQIKDRNIDDISDELLNIRGKDILLSCISMYNHGIYYGKLFSVDLYTKIQKVQKDVYKKIIGNANTAKYKFDDIITNDEITKKNLNLCKKIANASSPILIYGESGTGKELAASAIHNYSERKEKPYIAINCASIPGELLEAELFGYEEGAFTGAKRGGQVGIFEKANGGTIFLDEVSELPYHLQAKLLRVLQEKEIRKVGANYNIPIDVKVISATNKNLYDLIQKNEFRQDLFFRLNVFNIMLPPLRERKNDIPLLCKYFLNKYNSDKKVLPEFLRFALQYKWNGNIRELENLIEFMTVTSEYDIGIRNLPDYIKQSKELQNLSFNEELNLKEYMMLKLIGEQEGKEKNKGRRSLTELFNYNYFQISEMEIRKILEKLKKEEMIIISTGRKGCSLSEKGIYFLHKNS